MVVLLVLLCGACSINASVPTASRAAAPSPPGPAAEPTPPPELTPAPTVQTTPTVVPTPEPTATPVDLSAPVVVGDGWIITENDVAALAAFVESAHELEFNEPVGVLVDPDIGATYAVDVVPFEPDDWSLLVALGIAPDDADRDVVNQVRLDRIRGVCCEQDRAISVVVEAQPTKLGTELILVHELTHALHMQHPELFPRRDRSRTGEIPRPFSAAVEGIPQFIAFEYLDGHDAAERAEVEPNLQIIGSDLVDQTGTGPARYLNFVYSVGPELVEAVVDAQGRAGLSQLAGSPPISTEQVLFPRRYLEREEPVEVRRPGIPAGAVHVSEGRLGAALLLFAIADAAGSAASLDLISGWAGDSYVLFEQSAATCLRATIEMDSAEQARALFVGLKAAVPTSTGAVGLEVAEATITVATC